MISDEQVKVLQNLISIFEQHHIQYNVLGGLAAIAYGSSRSLVDIDVKIYRKDIPIVKELLGGFISRPFKHSPGEHFDIYFMTVDINGVSVDISQAEDFYVGNGKNYRQIEPSLENPTIVTVKGVNLAVEPIEKLIAYKRFLGRPVDYADLEELKV